MRSLASRCRKSVDGQLRHRGSTYASDGRVRLLRHEATEPFVTAVVRGSAYGKTYQVRIDWRHVARDSLNVECDCPYAASSFECKHIWAVLLELDRLGMATRVPGNQDLWLVNPRLVSPKAPPLLPPWRQRLDALLLGGAPNSAPEGGAEPVVREVWLALDPKIPASGTLHIEFLQRQQTMTGGWGKLRALSLAPDEPVSGPPALVSACAVLLDLLPPPEPWRYNPRVTASGIHLARHLAPLLVPQLCATGRFGARVRTRGRRGRGFRPGSRTVTHVRPSGTAASPSGVPR